MKAIRSFFLTLFLMVGVSAAHADWSQTWGLGGIGSFNALGMRAVSGGTLGNPALAPQSPVESWVEIGTSTNAFASFNATTALDFSTLLSTAPSSFLLFVWHGDVPVAAYLVDTDLNVSAYTGPSPTRIEQHRLAGPVPEPETYAMLFAGIGILAIRRKIG